MIKVFTLFQHPSAIKIAEYFQQDLGKITLHHFPDLESYVRFDEAVLDKTVIFVDSLERPNQKIMPLLFAAKTAKELGANRVGLVAPYLAYMRQDLRFKPGEAITSACFASILSNGFDWLITMDPHLHRYHSLDEIYQIPSNVVASAPYISQWIKSHCKNVLLIGPDIESTQWVQQIADDVNAPMVILTKQRHGDREVTLSLPDLSSYKNYQPVLVDDIISTGQTLIAAIALVKQAQLQDPICIGVHGVFTDTAYDDLMQAGAKMVLTCNTIAHKSNRIDVADGFCKAIKEL